MKNSNLFLASKELENIDIDFGDEVKEKEKEEYNSRTAEVILNIKSNEIKLLCLINYYKRNRKNNKFFNIIELQIFDTKFINDILFNNIYLKQITLNNKKIYINAEVQKIKYKDKKLKILFYEEEK